MTRDPGLSVVALGTTNRRRARAIMICSMPYIAVADTRAGVVALEKVYADQQDGLGTTLGVWVGADWLF